MMKLFKKLFSRCPHTWMIVKQVNIWGSPNDTTPIATKMILRCKHCGKKVRL